MTENLIYNEYIEELLWREVNHMHELKHSSHRFSNYEENVHFLNEDGIDVFLTGARFQHCLSCTELEFQLETKEMIESALSEKRKHPQSFHDFSFLDLP